MNYIKIFILLIYLGNIACPVLAQQDYIFNIQKLGMKDGLLTNNINNIFEDSRGVMWLASDYGLNSYDGVEMESYTVKDGLASTIVNNISEDPNGNLWLSCEPYFQSESSLFSILNPLTKKISSLGGYISDFGLLDTTKIIHTASFENGKHFIYTEKEVFEFDGKKISQIVVLDDPYFVAFPIMDTVVGVISLSQKELHFYDTKKKKILHSHFTNPERKIITFLPSDSIGTAYWVESAHDSDFVQTFVYKKEPTKAVVNLEEVVLNKGQREVLDQSVEYTLSPGNKAFYHDNVVAKIVSMSTRVDELGFENLLLIDSKEGIWTRNRKNGGVQVHYFTPSLFTTYKLFDEWVGVRGITLVDSILMVNGIHSFEEKKGKDGLRVHCLKSAGASIFDDKKGNLWVVNEYPSISVFDYEGKEKAQYHFEVEKPSKYWVNWTMHQDKEGQFWIGSINGLFNIDLATRRVIPVEDHTGYEFLQKSSVYFFYEKGENLWIGSSSGLYRYHKKNGVQERFHTEGIGKYYLPHNSIAHIYEDKEGVFWLASKGGGLIEFNPKTGETEQYTTEKSLANDVLYAVYEDDYNNLWLSSNLGIMRFNKQTKIVNSYTEDNGLLDNEFNTSAHFKDDKGRIYFGSQLGVVSFHPKDFRREDEEQEHLLHITSVDVLDRATDQATSVLASVLASNTIALTANDKGFEIKVVLLDYRNPQQHQYAYKIEGFDKEWHYQKNPIIKQNNLPYGTYQMRLKVKGINGSWVTQKNAIQISVLRPYYLQYYFIGFVLFLLIMIIVIGIRWRTYQLRVRQKELEVIVFKRTQKIAQQTEDLKALDKVKSRFFANITHELRTPLTLILGPASTMLRKAKQRQLNEQQAVKKLGMIVNSGEHLLDLIEEILDLSKLEADKLDLILEAVHLKSYVSLLFNTFNSQAEYLGISYELEFNANSDLYVSLDPKKVTKILNNLLANALKFTPTNHSVRMVVNEENEVLEFVVKDDGRGIHSDDLPHVFERFYQSRQVDRPAQGGTGIGLALVQEFTKMMRGSATVDSELGVGTTFTIRLPKLVTEQPIDVALEEWEEEVDGIMKQEAGVPMPKKNTILLVEDHVEMRSFIIDLLDMHYNVLTATNGIEGLQELKKSADKIELIISDVMMPEMDGFVMLQKIKAHPKWRSIPMIMLTARAAIEDKLNALTIGVDDYLTKPFSVEELTVRIANLLKNAAARSEWEEEEEGLVSLKKEKDKEPDSETIAYLIEEEDLAWVKSLEELVTKQLDKEEISIVELAKQLFISERHLRRKLKKITGLSPSKLIREIQMKTARRYLESKTYSSVADVAFAVGFQTPSAFSKVYKKHYGKTPKEFLQRK